MNQDTRQDSPEPAALLPWSAPQLTMLGSLASQTGAFQVSATDAPDGTGTLAGSSGSTS